MEEDRFSPVEHLLRATGDPGMAHEDFRMGVATPAMPTLQEWEGILRRLAALVDRLEQAIEKLELDEVDEEVLRND